MNNTMDEIYMELHGIEYGMEVMGVWIGVKLWRRLSVSSLGTSIPLIPVAMLEKFPVSHQQNDVFYNSKAFLSSLSQAMMIFCTLGFILARNNAFFISLSSFFVLSLRTVSIGLFSLPLSLLFPSLPI
uniref:Uncharacterized protein n=1 Tax=Cacopsylla melanoneura TaxID=428564 RepID=A0A8D9EA75_9HEMI